VRRREGRERNARGEKGFRRKEMLTRGEGRTGREPVARESKKRDQVRPDSNTRGIFVCSTVAL